MKLQDQVCTYEQGKRLGELGIFNRSQFNWWEFENKKTKEIKIGWTFGGVGEWQDGKSWNRKERYSAFTVAELGMMLDNNALSQTNEFGEWIVYQRNTGTAYNWILQDKMQHTIIFKTEAQARAAMCIYLLENNLITAEEINNRLNQ